jgi:hypothetical protein
MEALAERLRRDAGHVRSVGRVQSATPTSSSTSRAAPGIAASARSIRRSSSVAAASSNGEERSTLNGHSAMRLAAAESSSIRDRL